MLLPTLRLNFKKEFSHHKIYEKIVIHNRHQESNHKKRKKGDDKIIKIE
jgi:hypothetical protein